MESSRLTMVTNENFSVDLEYSDSLVAMHFILKTDLTKSLYKEFKETLDKLQDFIETVGYPSLLTGVLDGDEVAAKLAVKFGFVYQGSSDGIDIYMRKS